MNLAVVLKQNVPRVITGFGFLPGTPATTSAATTGFSLGFNKPAGSATPFALPVTSTSAGGLSLSSALTSTPAAGRKMFRDLGLFSVCLLTIKPYCITVLSIWFCVIYIILWYMNNRVHWTSQVVNLNILISNTELWLENLVIWTKHIIQVIRSVARAD